MLKTALSTDYRKYVQAAYEADHDLVQKWHIVSGRSVGDCIERTVKDLTSFVDLVFYVVHDEEKFVGYFATEFNGAFLSTIFIMPEYRDRKDAFWAEIEKKVTPKFWAGIFSKNTPCMRFYSKRGKVEVKGIMPDGEVTVFEFERAGA